MSRLSNTCSFSDCIINDPFCERDGCDAVYWPRVLELEKFDTSEHDDNINSAQEQLRAINSVFKQRLSVIQNLEMESAQDIQTELEMITQYSDIIARYSNILSKLTSAKERDGREFRSDQKYVRMRYELTRSEDELRVEGIILFCRVVWASLGDLRTDDIERYREIKELLIDAQHVVTAGLVDITDVQPVNEKTSEA